MTRKIAISLPDETLGKATAAVRAGKAPNLSNYIGALIEDASAKETFQEMISEWIRESGASAEEIRSAEEESRAAFERAGIVSTRRRGTRGASTKNR
ncbi:MAG: hypothetical protein WKG00_06090 [Polyangiaceae bacterium]